MQGLRARASEAYAGGRGLSNRARHLAESYIAATSDVPSIAGGMVAHTLPLRTQYASPIVLHMIIIPSMTADEYRALRESRGWSQMQLATLLGVALSTVSKRERGENPIDHEAALAIRRLVESDA